MTRVATDRSFSFFLSLFLELKRNVGDELVMVVVANKLDLESRREVTLEQAREYVTRALGPDTLLYEASAKDDDGR
jgi:GTPase SAR1 family protein